MLEVHGARSVPCVADDASNWVNAQQKEAERRWWKYAASIYGYSPKKTEREDFNTKLPPRSNGRKDGGGSTGKDG